MHKKHKCTKNISSDDKWSAQNYLELLINDAQKTIKMYYWKIIMLIVTKVTD